MKIMKKIYKNPTLEVIKIQTQKMLAASDPVLGNEYNSSTDGEPLGREFGDDFEDEGF